MEPITFALASGLAVLGAVAGHKRVQLGRFLQALEAHPRVEVRERAQGRVLFSALVACPPRGAVSVVLDRTTGALEWTLEAHLVRAGPLKLALDRRGARTDDEALRAQLEGDAALTRARARLWSDTWDVQRLAICDGGLRLEARERARVGQLDVAQVVRRAEVLALVAEALGRLLAGAGKGERAPLCPSCRSVALHLRAGELGEAACPNCKGRFLAPEASRRLVEQELGEDLFALRDASRDASGERACAGCHRDMRPVLARGRIVDLCAGCGSIWLDEDELSWLSAGRYREVGL